MKTNIICSLSLIFFLLGCVSAPVPTPVSVADVTQVPAMTTPIISTSTIAVSPTPTTIPSSATATLYPFTPTFISASLPSDLVVSYVVEDELWVWKQNSLRLLAQRQNISDPMLSDDGQWLLFRQRHIQLDGSPPSDEVWVMRTDGSEVQRLLGSDDLMTVAGGEESLLIGQIGWLPGRHEILLNTHKITEGPPGSWPAFDLYSLDLSGHVTRLAEPGKGGKFIPSPQGTHVALVTDSRIGVLDLESGEQRSLLEFERVGLGCECLYTPKVVWDPQGNFVMTSILPKNFYYPTEYAGEPEKVWRLFVSGKAELVTQFQPASPFTTEISVAPDFQNFLYFKGSCPDAMGTLYVRSLTTGEEYSLSCLMDLPQWMPDSEHFIYKLGTWQLGNIYDTTSQPLDFLNVPTDPNVHASPQLIWISNEYFLLVLRSRDACTLNVATLQGVVTEIASTPPELCPRTPDFSLSR